MAACKERGLRGYSGKTREQLLAMLEEGTGSDVVAGGAGAPATAGPIRLNYIGSKYQLLDWLDAEIRARTGWDSFAGRRIADLFAGTGIVSWHFRCAGAAVIANDAETYSSIITAALVSGVYTPALRDTISALNAEIEAGNHASETGYITQHYSPATGGERLFFTADNARRIDYLRRRFEELTSLSPDDRVFLIASLLLAADAVSNVPAVYGCYLKSFKEKARRPLVLRPVHERAEPPVAGSHVLREDVTCLAPGVIAADAVYLDPPYNERQYSKNYFPLNVIARGEAMDGVTLGGKTGIPSDCFLSPFCRRKDVAGAFERVIAGLTVPWIFVSYSSEGLISRADLEALLAKYGEVTVSERTYKRFKSFKYNESGEVREYLFCLHKTTGAIATTPEA